MIKDFINIADFSGEQLAGLLERALADKALLKDGKLIPSLPRKTLGMIFEKQSLRTRASFETAMTQLGGHAIYLAPEDIGLGTREPVRDIARVLGRMCDGIMARTFSHELAVELAKHAPVPVINGLTDYSHPCQAMADLMTIQEQFGELGGKTIAFIGDGNNVARSLACACGKLGMKFTLAAPEGYELDDASVSSLTGSGLYQLKRSPTDAVASADVVCADTWISMHQEVEKEKRIKDFAPYQLNAELLTNAPKHVMVLHCLPAYRGYEITDEVLEAHAETIFRESENRLHFQRSLLNILIGEGGIR
jgi:ornithine carbamoyltransferase